MKILQQRPVFAIHPEIGLQLLSSAVAVLAKQSGFAPEMFDIRSEDSRIERLTYTTEPSQQSKKSSIYVLPIRGTMLAEDQECGPVGMLTQARMIRRAANDDEIHGIVLDIMSPGGMVMGGNELEAAVAYARSKKPVLAYVNGMACSMAYAVAIQADHIMMNGPQAEVGSIGVTLHYLDFTEKLRKEGIVEVKVLSTYSPDKNKYNYSEPDEQDIQLIQSEMLDPLALSLRESVTARRSQVNANALTGNCYYTAEALEMGLADEAGTWEAAMAWMVAAINNPKTETDMGIFQKKKDTEPAADVTASEVSIEQLQQEHEEKRNELQGKLNTAQQENQQLSEAIAGLRDQLAEQANQVSDLVKQVSQLTARIELVNAAPVNEVADPEGDEGAPAADADAQPPAAPSWAGPWDKQLKTLDQE